MKACGIIAEYNPFHKGHAYQIEKIKEKSDAEIIIVIMSGNFLQRGEPAIVDKWTRTKMALDSGVDLVLELPVLWASQPADIFAQGAVQMLNDLNIDYLSFGTESGEREDFLEAAEYLNQNENKIDQMIRKDSDMNMSYAQKVEKIILELNPDFPLDLSLPNIQLGLSYQRELFKLESEKTLLLPIKRKGSSYKEERINQHPQIASATAIRKAVFNQKKYASYLPKKAATIFNQKLSEKVSWENYFLLLKYQLLIKSKDELRQIYQMTEGLENRLKKFISNSFSFEEYIDKIKTKRYTRTRLQRLLVYVLLDIRKKEIKKIESPEVHRVLGFTEKGRSYLNQEKKMIRFPLISNVNRETKTYVKNDIKAGKIYRLGNKFIREQDFNRKPLIFD